MSDFSTGSVHGPWTVTAQQQDGAVPRYAVKSQDGVEGTLTFYPFGGSHGLIHRGISDRLKAWEGVSHDSLQQVTVGHHDDGVFVIQPGDLERLEGSAEADEVLSVLESAAQALAVFHQKGLAHGELDAWCFVKNGGGRSTLMPPGLRPPPPGTGRLGLQVDPRYASPEVLDGRRPSPQSDMFSLGLVLYRLMTGKPPVNAADPEEAFVARGKTPAPNLSKAVSGLAGPMAGLYEKLTAIEPYARPANAKELLNDLAAVRKGKVPLKNEPAVPEIEAERIGGPVMVLLLLTAAVGGMYWYATQVLIDRSPLEGHQFVMPAVETPAPPDSPGGEGTGTESPGGEGETPPEESPTPADSETPEESPAATPEESPTPEDSPTPEETPVEDEIPEIPPLEDELDEGDEPLEDLPPG